MDYIESKYNRLCQTPLDINEHLPALFYYASECESVVELGVRGCISSWAFIWGLLQNGSPNKKFLMNDIMECDIHEVLESTKDLDIKIEYQWKNDLELDLDGHYDLVFIDTWHVYGQLKRELAKFAPITNKYIIMHDTEVDGIYGEIHRLGYNGEPQAKASGIPIEEIYRGLLPAIEEFLANNPEWKMIAQYTNNNGLTILERQT